MTTMAEAIKRYVQAADGNVSADEIERAITSEYPDRWRPSTLQAHLYACAVNNSKAYIHHPYAEKFLYRNSDRTFALYSESVHGPNRWAPSIGDDVVAGETVEPERRVRQAKNLPMPTVGHLQQAHEEFKRIEPRDFFYWSVSKLVASILDVESKADVVDELARALMMLLMTWNKNYYRFFEKRKPGMTLEEHFTELEGAISTHLPCLTQFRRQRLQDVDQIPEREIRKIYDSFHKVLGRVGAAKCLHLLAPGLLPLWDAAILRGYGLEAGKFRVALDGDRYIEFLRITRAQLAKLGDFGTSTENALKWLDEYNYCVFTKKLTFD